MSEGRQKIEEKLSKHARGNTALLFENLQNSRVFKNELSSKTVRKSEQFSFWRDVAVGAGVIERTGSYDSAFIASSENYITSSVLYARHRARHQSSIDRSRKYAENFGADAMAVQYRVSGLEVENSFGTDQLLKPGDIRIFDMSQPLYSNNLSYDNLALIVPKKDLMGRLSQLETLHGQVLPKSAMTEMLRTYIKSAFTTVSELATGQTQHLNDTTIEMLSAAILTAEQENILESEDMNNVSLRAVRAYIERNLSDPDLNPEHIARGIAVSRTKLYGLCKPYGAPMELVRYRRLRRAMDYLRTGKIMTIEQVSYAVGYRNRESFSRAFKSEFGVSPAEFVRK